MLRCLDAQTLGSCLAFVAHHTLRMMSSFGVSDISHRQLWQSSHLEPNEAATVRAMVTAIEAPADVNVVERALIDLQQLRRHRPGTVLFREGDVAAGVYIIHSGTIELLATSRTGAVTPVQTAEAGHIVGLSSVVSNHPYDASAVVRESSELGYIDANALRRLLDRQPAVWFAVLRFLSNDVNACWESMRKVAAFR